MAPKPNETCVTLAFVVVLWGGATAQSSCMSALAGLSSCLNYITGNTSTPTSSCCSSLSRVVQKQPQCLCALWNARGSPVGRIVNQTLAQQLPRACGVLTQCNAGASGPTTSSSSSSRANTLSSSPAESTANTPESAVTGSGSGSKTTDGSTASESNIRAPLYLLVSVLLIVSCVSISL